MSGGAPNPIKGMFFSNQRVRADSRAERKRNRLSHKLALVLKSTSVGRNQVNDFGK